MIIHLDCLLCDAIIAVSCVSGSNMLEASIKSCFELFIFTKLPFNPPSRHNGRVFKDFKVAIAVKFPLGCKTTNLRSNRKAARISLTSTRCLSPGSKTSTWHSEIFTFASQSASSAHVKSIGVEMKTDSVQQHRGRNSSLFAASKMQV